MGGRFAVQDPQCSFCQIERGKLPGFMVLETEETLGFLDIRPLFIGHTLLIPRQHYETLPDLPSELLAPMMADVTAGWLNTQDTDSAAGGKPRARAYSTTNRAGWVMPVCCSCWEAASVAPSEG